VEAANKEATLVPLSVLERCPRLLELAAIVAEKGNQSSLSDAGVAGLAARAGATGAYYNVLINLRGIEDAPWRAEIRARADVALARAEVLAASLDSAVLEKLRR
jgi:glutamate formiminotransferase/formiminotetrahydrofolate cyclodeaminase